MGTISDKLMRIINTKEDIRQALISKGYDVPTSIPFKEYAKMILDLPCKVDSFPDIEGIVARYSASGLTNEQMAANPVWVDKTGNGYDLQMKSFAWDGMSGCDGYTESFLGDKINWESEIYNSRKMSVFGGNRSKVSIIHNQYHFQTYVKISGIDDNEGKVRGVYFYNMESSFTEGTICRTDGIYKIDITELNERGVVGIWAYPAKKNEEVYDYPVTIEILPLYPGALVFDGVDDYGTCDNFPILTKEKGYTVVALRQYITRNEGPLGLVSNVKNWFKDGAFLLEFREIAANQFNRPISFGAVGKERDLPCVLTYQTSKSYNGVSIEAGNFTGTDVLHVGKLSPKLAGYCNAAIWELVFLDHDATEEELTKIKDYFVKTYPWLFPDQAWTVTGKTNEDEDRATIANITGNGNDLVLSNFGFAEGSGYGLYFFGSFHSDLGTNINYTHIGFSQITLHNVKTEISSVYTFVKSISAGQKIDYTIKISGLTALNEANPGFRLTNSQSRAGLALDVSSDGIYHIQGTVQESDYTYVTCTLAHDNGNIPTDLDLNVTIEQIPEYEGYLVTDGVDDKIDSSAFKMGEDFTVVGEWKLLPVSSLSYSGMLKNDNLYLYNNASTGLRVYIRSTDARNDMEGLKSLKAICSDGRVYGEDWTEYKLSIGSTIGSQSRLYLGYNNTAYTKMAFKNLGIYNNQILSKEDCIKAYNYLQTLKSK